MTKRKKNKHAGNSHAKDYIENSPDKSIFDDNDTLSLKCKFNFDYVDYSNLQLPTLLSDHHSYMEDLWDKLKNFSNNSLEYWSETDCKASKRGHYLDFYACYPTNSKFKYPKHVPKEAQWGRFCISGKQRLIGFIIPEDCCNKNHPKTNMPFDKNTFYIVFFDPTHEFYPVNL